MTLLFEITMVKLIIHYMYEFLIRLITIISYSTLIFFLWISKYFSPQLLKLRKSSTSVCRQIFCLTVSSPASSVDFN